MPVVAQSVALPPCRRWISAVGMCKNSRASVSEMLPPVVIVPVASVISQVVPAVWVAAGAALVPSVFLTTVARTVWAAQLHRSTTRRPVVPVVGEVTAIARLAVFW